MKEKQFMPHVAGLRCLAILAVLWFHFTQYCEELTFFKKLSYGYLGVDVFIVIMGYFLIRGFSKPDIIPAITFFRSKISRLIPALVVTMLFTYAIGISLFDISELKNMSKVGTSALYGWSNVTLKSVTSGYFSEDASTNPFLHTWYLSVTLQLFLASYIIYRIAKKIPQRVTIISLIVVGIASFVVYVFNDLREIVPFIYAHTEPNSPYYDTFPRVWELLAGGAILMMPECTSTKWRHALAGIGVVCIVWPMLLSGSNHLFVAVPAVIGTMLVVKYGFKTFVDSVLSCRPVVWIGNISYSVYLIHMPLLVAYRIYTFEQPSDTAITVLFILSILLGFILWWGIEKRKLSWRILLIGWLLALAISITGKRSNGFEKMLYSEGKAPSIHPHHRYQWQQEQDLKLADGLDCSVLEPAFFSQGVNPQDTPPLKRIGDSTAAPSFVLIGDSHIYHTGIALDHICRKEKLSGVMLDSIILPFYNRGVKLASPAFYYYNKNKFEALLSWLQMHPEFKTIIICQVWNRLDSTLTDWSGNKTQAPHKEPLFEFFEQLASLNRTVVVLEPTPFFKSAAGEAYFRAHKRQSLLPAPESPLFTCTDAHYKQYYSHALEYLNELEAMKAVRLIRLQPHFFKDGSCHNFQGDYVICGDTNHLTTPGAQKMGEYIAPQIIPIINQQQ